jgi:drug/metabolite transporter (DMT)-like permease
MMFYALALFNVFVAAVAQMLLKKAAITPHKSFIKEYLNPWVIGGYSLMVFSLVSNVYVLSQGVLLKELGTIEAASYLFVPVLAFVCFKEKINLRKVTAIALILVGVVVFFWE